MNKKEAERHAIYLWGPNAVVARATANQRSERFRVGYVGRASDSGGSDQSPAVYLLGVGDSWEVAFDQAKDHPAAVKQQERISKGRAKIGEALKAQQTEVEQEKNDNAEHE
jgi:hypothetical protein